MNNETKNPTAQEAVKDQIASTLRHIDRRIAKLTEDMNNNYLHFFEWQAEEMFKVQKRRSFYVALADAVEKADTTTDLTTWLLDIANRKVNEIARGSLTRNSTSPMMNRAHLLNLEAEQELIRELEGLAHVAQYHSK